MVFENKFVFSSSVLGAVVIFVPDMFSVEEVVMPVSLKLLFIIDKLNSGSSTYKCDKDHPLVDVSVDDFNEF